MSCPGPGGSEAAFSGLLSSDVALVCQIVLPEDLRPLVPLEALQGEEVECPEAEGGLVLLRPGPGEAQAQAQLAARVQTLTAALLLLALHWNAALHHPSLPAAHHGSLLPGLHSGKTLLLANSVCLRGCENPHSSGSPSYLWLQADSSQSRFFRRTNPKDSAQKC